MIGILKLAGAAAVAAGVALFLTSAPMKAELSAPVISDGELPTDKNNTVVPDKTEKPDAPVLEKPSELPLEITDTVKFCGKDAISATETMVVRNGGVLYLDEGCTAELRGTLKIENGGEVYIMGALDSKAGSLIINNGLIKIVKGGGLSLGGKLAVNKAGIVSGGGTLDVLNDFSDIVCNGTVTAPIKAPEPVVRNGVTYVGGVLLVNKQYGLPEDFGTDLNSSAYSALLKMREASGYEMEISSGYRSYATQKSTFEYWASIDGYEKASTYSALPGHSEHQAGLAMDITTTEDWYADTDEAKWLAENCWRYGFIIRYPEGKTHITGYIYEPWHIRYLGNSTAKLVHDSGLTLEEFLGVV